MSANWKSPAICWHTDPGEAFLIGTKESYIQLAEILLKLAASDPEKISIIDDVTVRWPTSRNYLTEFGLDVAIAGIGLVETKEDAARLVNHFRRLNGELPLAGE